MPCQRFARNDGRKENGQKDAELVHRRDASGFTELQGSEIAEQGKTCRQTGQPQKEHVRNEIAPKDQCDWVNEAIIQVKRRITVARIAVAKIRIDISDTDLLPELPWRRRKGRRAMTR
jgi:hypothetical protein